MTTGRGPGPGPLLAIGAVVAGTAGVRLALHAAGPPWADLGLALDAAGAAAVAVTARWVGRHPRDRRSRYAWAYLTAGALVWLVAPPALLLGAPFGVAEAARGGAVLLLGASWWCAARAGGTLSRVRAVVDGGIGAAAVVVLAWNGPLATAWDRAGGGLPGAAAVALPVAMAGVAVLGTAVTVSEMPRGRRTRSYLFVGALLLLAGSDVAWSLGAAPVWAAGWVGYAAAIRTQVALTPRVTRVPTRGRLVYLPYAFIAPSAVVLAVQSRGGDVRAPQVAAGLVIVALLVARQHVTLLENDRLVARLEATERLLRHRATHDALTGLPGRAALHERLAALASAGPGEAAGARTVALAFVDVDAFKDVNDRHGHATGDAVLVEVARRLRAALARLGSGAFAARLGGDEFAVLVVRRDAGGGTAGPTGDPGTAPATALAAELATVLTAAVSGPLDVGTGSVGIAASVGVATTGAHRFSPSDLLHRADLAMYEVKRRSAVVPGAPPGHPGPPAPQVPLILPLGPGAASDDAPPAPRR